MRKYIEKEQITRKERIQKMEEALKIIQVQPIDLEMGWTMITRGSSGLLPRRLMTKIKFSYRYSKILDSKDCVVKYATLLGVFKINLEEQAKIFLDYDTDFGVYPLPKKGEYLMLLFQKPRELCPYDKNLFTTLRRATPKKEAYYRLHIGEDFEVVLDLMEEKEIPFETER